MPPRKKASTAIEKSEQPQIAGTSEFTQTISPPRRAANKVAEQSEGTGKRNGTAKHIDHSAIAHRAWEIWQKEGCPAGRETENWLQAERELLYK